MHRSIYWYSKIQAQIQTPTQSWWQTPNQQLLSTLYALFAAVALHTDAEYANRMKSMKHGFVYLSLRWVQCFARIYEVFATMVFDVVCVY